MSFNLISFSTFCSMLNDLKYQMTEHEIHDCEFLSKNGVCAKQTILVFGGLLCEFNSPNCDTFVYSIRQMIVFLFSIFLYNCFFYFIWFSLELYNLRRHFSFDHRIWFHLKIAYIFLLQYLEFVELNNIRATVLFLLQVFIQFMKANFIWINYYSR